MKIFSTPSTLLLKRSLDLLMGHNRNIAENVSRMNEPGYNRKPTRFLDDLNKVESQLRLRKSDSRHISPESVVSDAPDWEKGPVQLTREMADLAQNQIRYDFSIRILRRRYEGLIQSITGRTR